MNRYMMLICGKSASGKSTCLRNLENPKGVWYMNCEAGKELPFAHDFNQFVITDPTQVVEGIKAAEAKPEVHTIVIDSLTYLMDMYVNKYVLHSEDTRAAWGHFAAFVQKLMLEDVALSTKNLIFTAHTLETLNEAEKILETKVPVAGKLKNQGIESFFSTVISCKKMALEDLENYQNPLLTVNEDEQELEFKYVFQTRLTKDTVHERLRGTMGLWSRPETYIDNDVQHVIDRLRGKTKPASTKAA